MRKQKKNETNANMEIVLPTSGFQLVLCAIRNVKKKVFVVVAAWRRQHTSTTIPTLSLFKAISISVAYTFVVYFTILFLCARVYAKCTMCICIGNRERESERAVFGLNFDSFIHFFRKILYFFSHCLFLGLIEHFSLFQHPTFFFCSVLPHVLFVRSQCSHSHSYEIRLSRNEMLICNHLRYLCPSPCFSFAHATQFREFLCIPHFLQIPVETEQKHNTMK